MKATIKMAIPLSCLMLLLSGCLHEEEATSQSTQYEFVNQSLTVLNRTETIVENVSEDLETSEMFGAADGSSSNNAFFKTQVRTQNEVEISSKLAALTNWRTGLGQLLNNISSSESVHDFSQKIQTKTRSANNRINHSDSEDVNLFSGNIDFTSEEISNIFNEFFNPPSQNGNTFTYTVKSSICDNIVIAQERQNCFDVTSALTLEFTSTSSTSGTVDIKINNFTPISYSYSPTRIALIVDLNDIKSTAETFAQMLGFNDKSSPFPSTFEGQLSVYVELTSNNSVEVGMSTPKAINIDGNMDGELIVFNLAKSDRVFSIKADQSNSTIEMSFGIKTLYTKFLQEIGNALFELNIPEASGTVSIDIIEKTANFINLGLGASLVTLNINDQRALEIGLNKLSGTYDGENETAVFSSDLNFSLLANNIHSDMNDIFSDAVNPSDSSLNGTFNITGTSGLTLVNADENKVRDDVLKISAGGPLTFSGTGYFNMSESISTDECFVWENSVGGGFTSGFSSGDCSTLLNNNQ